MANNYPGYPPQNIVAVLKSLTKFGITNKNMQAAILATVSKESGMVPKNELGWGQEKSTTKPSPAYPGLNELEGYLKRIRSTFTTRVGIHTDKEFAQLSPDKKALESNRLTDAQLDALRKDYKAFFERVYGYQTQTGKYLGNTQAGDGWKYVGRGFNGITGRGLYDRYGKMIGVDLIASPERLNEVPVAADALAAYYKDSFSTAKASGDLKKKIGVNDVNEIADLQTAVRAAVQANAGWKNDIDGNSTLKEGLNKALMAAGTFLTELSSMLVTTVKEHKGASATGALVLALAAVVIWKRKEIKNFFVKHKLA
jgi:predicted chitinase